MSLINVNVPDIGDFDAVSIIEILVKVGDTIEVDQSILTVESDKASMEIPATAGGIVKEILVQVGDNIKEGVAVLKIESASAETASTSTPSSASTSIKTEDNVSSVKNTGTASMTLCVPDIGDFEQVTVIEILANIGDTIEAEQSILTVESDKASMEIPATSGGVIQQILVKIGDGVKQGTPIFVVSSSSVSNTVASEATQPNTISEKTAVNSTNSQNLQNSQNVQTPQNKVNQIIYAGPAARQAARTLNRDLSEIQGTGKRGRITVDDVRSFTKENNTVNIQNAQNIQTSNTVNSNNNNGNNTVTGNMGFDLLAWPKVDFSKFGATTTTPLSRIKKISGANLHRNWVRIPHVTQFDEADITNLEQFRKDLNQKFAKQNVKITALALVMKAAVGALQKFPDFNASLSEDGENLILKQYYNIGFAADTPNGLMVPVIKDVEKKGIKQIALELADLSLQAREGKLKPADMQGASFTISSLGGIGGTAFTPIVNAPEVAILGLSRSQMKPVWNEKTNTFEPRLMLPLSLSYDHRVIDGAQGARFTVYLSELLNNLQLLLV